MYSDVRHDQEHEQSQKKPVECQLCLFEFIHGIQYLLLLVDFFFSFHIDLVGNGFNIAYSTYGARHSTIHPCLRHGIYIFLSFVE